LHCTIDPVPLSKFAMQSCVEQNEASLPPPPSLDELSPLDEESAPDDPPPASEAGVVSVLVASHADESYAELDGSQGSPESGCCPGSLDPEESVAAPDASDGVDASDPDDDGALSGRDASDGVDESEEDVVVELVVVELEADDAGALPGADEEPL
jgi:hypothetical protein